MSDTGNNPIDPTTSVREPHQHTDGLPPTTVPGKDLKAAAEPTTSVPADPEK